MSVKWLRPEFEGREDELETRVDFEGRTGVSAQSLSSKFTNYADRTPKVAKLFGRTKFFVAAELDEFVAWIDKNAGTRSDTDIRRAEIARLEAAIEESEASIAEHEAKRDVVVRRRNGYKRKLRVKQEELEFLKKAE